MLLYTLLDKDVVVVNIEKIIYLTAIVIFLFFLCSKLDF